ncbi:MAG: hypothetical protein KIS78_23100 [Labilithrix sp.]|nr:hypothetical protein [Labilithrix sp.]MCW5835307.1 hypothetical protein [Labilithrix sp.]
MHKALAVFVCGAVVASIGCADDDAGPGLRSKSGSSHRGDVAGETTAGSDTAPTSAESACAAVKPPTTLSDAKDARDVRIAGSAVFFQAGAKVFRVLKDGTAKKELYTSPNLVRSYVDATVMVLIETTPEAPEATIRVIRAIAPEGNDGQPAPEPAFPDFPTAADGALPGVTAATNFNAAGTRVFASDETSFYLLADTGDGDTIFQVSKDDPNARTALAQSANVITNPQIASGAVWYVRDQQRIFKVALADVDNGVEQGEPTEVFGIGYASCSLAVNERAAFCSVGSAVERRDLTGANPTTILDAQKSKTQALFGATLARDGALFVRSAAPDEKVKHVIRALEPSGDAVEETFVACGRGMVTDLAVDGASVVWTEEGAGVFLAPR